MKKLILLAAMLLMGAFTALYAVPANPAKYKYVQPDGSVIVLQTHGDEYCNWTTNEAGEIVEKGADGFWRPVSVSPEAYRARRRAAASAARRGRVWSSYENPYPTNFGDRKVLCFIANFTDSTFIIDNPKARVSAMLNEHGYSYNGASGSVRDYYIDNSLGQYRPQFDVYGPVTLSHSSAYYSNGNNGNWHIDEAIQEAYSLLSGQINIDDYDTDNDGDIDMVLFYYPGHNPAEHGGPEGIWPHQSTGYMGELGGKTLNRYFCTSELRGSSGTEMCGIGTTCHEFGHSLGLPDFYDTDYAENGYNTFTTGYCDLMASGNYNDDGRRPPYLSAIERNMLGWMDYPEEITSGNHVLGPIQENKAYITRSDQDGEFFVLECRNGENWDAPLSDWSQNGLLIYHVDRSEAYNVAGGLTGSYLWSQTNQINVYGGHPCYYLYPSAGEVGEPDELVYPGYYNVQSFAFTDWAGVKTGVALSNIAFDGTKSSFTVSYTKPRHISGTVTDTFGRPIQGAQVVLSQSAHPFNAAPALLSGDCVAETDAYGAYSIDLPVAATNDQILTVRKSGYIPVSLNVQIQALTKQQNFMLHREGEGVHTDLHYYNPEFPDGYRWIKRGHEAIGASIYYDSDDIATKGLAGQKLETVYFLATAETYESVLVFVQFGDEIVFVRDVTSHYTPDKDLTISVSSQNLIIPDTYMMIGYIITGLDTEEFNILVDYEPKDTPKGSYVCDWNEDPVNWRAVKLSDGYYRSLIIGANISAPIDPNFRDLGFAYIALQDGVPTAVAPADKTVYRVEWQLDGVDIAAPTSLASGAHTYMARLLYYDGTSERVYYETE